MSGSSTEVEELEPKPGFEISIINPRMGPLTWIKVGDSQFLQIITFNILIMNCLAVVRLISLNYYVIVLDCELEI